MPKRPTQESLLRHIYPANPEQVETTITWRKHPVVLIWQIGLPLLILVVGYIALVVVVVMVPDAVLGALLGILVLALICAPWIAWQWVDWMNDLYTVTEDRLIDIERLPFGLWEKRIETTLDKIQDIHTSIPHIVARALNFGDVIIETAGRAEPFTFNYVPHPIDVQNEIFRRLDEFRSKQQSRSVAEQQHGALSIVRKYYESTLSHPADKTEEE
jgi:uncharacterized membrane protein YdbT with pleckstrin-like domain